MSARLDGEPTGWTVRFRKTLVVSSTMITSRVPGGRSLSARLLLNGCSTMMRARRPRRPAASYGIGCHPSFMGPTYRAVRAPKRWRRRAQNAQKCE
ncbi:hypothetical protein AXK57_15015 [Tsukamurella pulmonis]|nr:hypothetical protein AXK57_15015 [Tsukamurella pulmonis]